MMKRLFVLILGLGLGALVAAPASAGCRVVRRYAAPVVVEAVASVPIVSAFVPAAVVAYGAAYAPGAVPTALPAQGQGQDTVAAALLRLEQRLVVIEQRQGPPTPSAAAMPLADAAPSGQERASTGQGALANLSADKQREVLRRVYATDPKLAMPRGGKPLSDEELGLVVQWVATAGPPAPEVVKLFSSRCASCHQSGREGAGGGFVLTLK